MTLAASSLQIMGYVITGLAEKAYSAYGESTGGKTFDGRDMPKWDDLGERIQAAWCAAAQAVVDEVTQ